MNGWRIDKNIPVALLLTIALQMAIALWWAGGLDRRVAANEDALKALQNKMQATEAFRDDLATVKNDISWIKNWLRQNGNQ